MNRIALTLAAAAAAGAIAAPALAQYPGQYPPNYPQGYGQQGYGQNPIQQVIDQLLGNRYNVDDRTAVSRCAAAVVAQASNQYRRPAYNQGYSQYNQYGQPYGQQQYAQPYGVGARVTAITNVERRNSGLRVTGMLDSGRYAAYGNQGYGQGYGYGNPNQPYAAQTGDLTFRCNVDYRGAVTNIRINQNRSYRRY